MLGIMRCYKLGMLAIVFFAMGFLIVLSGHAYAAPDEGTPKDAQNYTLTWPDGTSKTYETYDDMLADYDTYKLLAENLETDDQGNIVLPDKWQESGEIRIEEIEFPKGYTGDKYTDVNLSDGGATIVNEKVPDAPKPQKPFAPTGDKTQSVAALAGAVAIFAGICLFVARRKYME